MAQKYGIYDAYSLIEFSYTGEFVANHPKKTECVLGKSKYEIILEPLDAADARQDEYYNEDRPPFQVTIKKNGDLIVDKLSYSFQLIGAWIQKVVVEENDENKTMLYITAKPDNEKVKFSYECDSPDFKPITSREFYRPYLKSQSF